MVRAVDSYPSWVRLLDRRSVSFHKSLESVTFERDSQLERIEESAFDESRLKWIVIPSSVAVLGKRSFCGCKSLESVTFEGGSRFGRIKRLTFPGSGLKSILIPSSVAVLGTSSFLECKSLESTTFESGSRLERIDKLVLFEEEPHCIFSETSLSLTETGVSIAYRSRRASPQFEP
jgi:hypothetical protein